MQQMNEQIKQGLKVSYLGQTWKVQEIKKIPHMAPSGLWLVLEGFDSPVHINWIPSTDKKLN